MSSQLTGRRRAVGNRMNGPTGNNPGSGNNGGSSSNSNSNNNNNNTTGGNGCKSCDCSHSKSLNGKFRVQQGFDASGVIYRSLLLATFVFGIYTLLGSKPKHSPPLSSTTAKSQVDDTSLAVENINTNSCELRHYPKRRYYGLNDRPLPNFLETEYIYGELPVILHPSESSHAAHAPGSSTKTTKLCVDQSEWYHPKENDDLIMASNDPPLPFADGTNPSILKLANNPRIDPSVRELLHSGDDDAYYVATICMTDSQCGWNDTPEEIAEFHLSRDDKSSTLRTVLLVLDKNFKTLREATIHTKMNANFGRRANPPNNQYKTFKLDDARLFTHKGQIWVSYREGKLFGYDKQVLNKINFELPEEVDKRIDNGEGVASLRKATKKDDSSSSNSFSATLLASETETLCCGRNMALIDNVHTDKLQALTWVDPVTVVDVDVSKTDGEVQKEEHRRLETNQNKNRRRKKKDEKKKSHFHGTNGFMVHLPKTQEYMGIGHFHRPPDRNQNDYARFGHHYTHAFFTITDAPPFRLNRLSPELVVPSSAYPEDAEIIQFWSGLELSSGGDGDDSSLLALAYGINDCEGAATHLDLAVVEDLLRDVSEGKEVVDFMMPLK